MACHLCKPGYLPLVTKLHRNRSNVQVHAINWCLIWQRNSKFMNSGWRPAPTFLPLLWDHSPYLYTLLSKMLCQHARIFALTWRIRLLRHDNPRTKTKILYCFLKVKIFAYLSGEYCPFKTTPKKFCICSVVLHKGVVCYPSHPERRWDTQHYPPVF